MPKRKFILLILAGLLIAGTGFWVFTPAKKSKNSKQETSLNQPVIAEEINKDSDNDGLKDWEETLWKTDPNNPDTDKDGVPDGQEIKENRNPLLAGNDETDKIKSPNLTEALGWEFFSEYMRLKQESGDQLSEAEKTELVNSLMSGLNSFEKKPNDYLESDIKIAPTDDEKTIKEYGNNFALIIKKYFDPLPETEMTILQRAVINKNEDELKKLEPLANAYRNTAKEMLSLTTPKGFSEFHLALINHLTDISKNIDDMQTIFKDPVQALLVLKQHKKNSIIVYLILRNLNGYFATNKVVFEENEPAEFFKIYMAAAKAKTK